jgi:hypothetical protein
VQATIDTSQRINVSDVQTLGKELYRTRIRALVEFPESIGKFVSIDVDTGDFAVGSDILQTADEVFARHPNARLWGERIGYDAVYALGAGQIVRTNEE